MKALLLSFEQFIDESIGRQRLGWLVLALILGFFLLYPQLPNGSNYARGIFITGFFFAILSSSWALLAGVSGQFSFGHMAFMGIGAYSAGLLGRDGFTVALISLNIPPERFPPVVSIIMGMIAAGVVGFIIGWLLLRLRAAYLALFTIAFSELFRIVMLTEFSVTGGMNGLSLPRLIDTGDPDQNRILGYYIMFGLLVVSLVVMYLIERSRLGLFLRAMREDEEAAAALGVNVVRYKIMIFVITSMIVGLAGGVYYHNIGAERITPETIEVLQMALVIAYAVIGGMESPLAAAFGAFFARYLQEAMREIAIPFTDIVFEPGAWRFALFGLLMVLTLRFARNGLLFPVITWFGGRDTAQKETVAKRVSAPESDGALAIDEVTS